MKLIDGKIYKICDKIFYIEGVRFYNNEFRSIIETFYREY